GEVLHQYPGRGELDLHARVGGRIPGAERADVAGGGVRAVLGAQQVLQKDLQAVWQPFRALHLTDLVDFVPGVADTELASGAERVEAGHVVLLGSLGIRSIRMQSPADGLRRLCRVAPHPMIATTSRKSWPQRVLETTTSGKLCRSWLGEILGGDGLDVALRGREAGGELV